MKFSGIQLVSLQDYPTLLSTIVWTQGCNKKCWWCSNPEMIPLRTKKTQISGEEVIRMIKEKNENQIWVESIVICGGEPTIQKGLVNFLYKIREELPYLKIKIDTNGTKPDVLKELIKRDLLDYIAMDIKVDELKNTEYLESVKLVNKFAEEKDGEFRWTVHPKALEKLNEVKEIFKNSKNIYLQKFSRKMKLYKDNKKMKSYTILELEEAKKILEEGVKNVQKRF